MKVLIAEDDILIAEHLHDILLDCDVQKVHLSHHKNDIIAQIDLYNPDLVLLDIHMDEKLTGIEIAQILNTKYSIPFVYITAQSDKFVMDQAIETNPFGYIIKPFNSKEIYALIQLAKKQLVKNYIFIKDIYGEIKLNIDNLIFAKADGNYLELVTTERKILLRSTILSFLNLLPADNFVHIHRSYLVNILHIQQISEILVLTQNFSIPYTKKKLEVIKSKLKIN